MLQDSGRGDSRGDESVRGVKVDGEWRWMGSGAIA